MKFIRVATGIAAGAALACLAPTAPAAPTCTYSPAQHLLHVTADPADFDTVVAVAPDGSICGGATVTNTDTIQVAGGGHSVDLRGAFEPGFSAEPGGRSEIEIAVSDPGVLRLDVPADAPAAAAGANGVNLNGDDDVDVTFGGDVRQVQLRRINGPKRLDHQPLTLTGQGGLGTGGPFAGDLQLVAGKGDDHVVGGNGQNVLRGLGGNDTIDGGPAVDFIEGGAGNDVLTGGAGQDRIDGDAGNDVLHAQDGAADKVDGGSGTDTADFDAGLDRLKNLP